MKYNLEKGIKLNHKTRNFINSSKNTNKTFDLIYILCSILFVITVCIFWVLFCYKLILEILYDLFQVKYTVSVFFDQTTNTFIETQEQLPNTIPLVVFCVMCVIAILGVICICLIPFKVYNTITESSFYATENLAYGTFYFIDIRKLDFITDVKYAYYDKLKIKKTKTLTTCYENNLTAYIIFYTGIKNQYPTNLHLCHKKFVVLDEDGGSN